MIRIGSSNFLSWGWIVFFWAIIALISTTMLFSSLSLGGDSPSFVGIFFIKLIVWLYWGAITPLVIKLGDTFSLDKEQRVKSILIHIPLSILFPSLNILLYAGIVSVLSEDPLPIMPLFLSLFFDQFEWYFLIYWAIILVGFTFKYYKSSRERELETINLEAELIRSQLHALKMQLQPHFLFNTLNNISSLVRRGNKDVAISMLAGISDLLRSTLSRRNEQEITLSEELDFTRKYLEIEKIRFNNKIEIEYEFEEDNLEALVPHFILQPVVENGINHGISKQIVAKKISIRTRREGELLHLEVVNEGPPLAQDFSLGENLGIGLQATKERLGQVYGSNFDIRLDNVENGVKVLITFPFVTQRSDEEI